VNGGISACILVMDYRFWPILADPKPVYRERPVKSNETPELSQKQVLALIDAKRFSCLRAASAHPVTRPFFLSH
jgi:hypothetical protein